MLPLRYARRWQVAGFAVLFIVLIAALSPAIWFMRDMHDARFFLSDKWLHGITFAFLTVWFSGQFARSAYWRLASGMLGFGMLIETCQYFLRYRTAETLDLVADMIGIVAGLAIASAGAGGWSMRFENWLLAQHARH
ncbi:MAG TPA: VanZ family protein [Woeseiaceae bacterium]|nr:VanZ family protein [Woeseiaceae bacterium]